MLRKEENRVHILGDGEKVDFPKTSLGLLSNSAFEYLARTNNIYR